MYAATLHTNRDSADVIFTFSFELLKSTKRGQKSFSWSYVYNQPSHAQKHKQEFCWKEKSTQ